MANSYGRRWRVLRLRVLREEGFRCYVPDCTNRATTGDHIIPADEAPHLFYVRSNIRASCPKHNFGRVIPRMAAQSKLNRYPGTLRPW